MRPIYTVFLTTLLISRLSFAGGITLYEIGTSDIRLASAGWSSRADDASTVFTNPAGMSRLKCPEIAIGGQAINAHIIFEPDTENTVLGTDGDANIWLPSGSSFYVQPINEQWTVGIGSLGYFGSDLHYNSDWIGRYYTTYTFLEGFSVVPAVSYQVNDYLSIGLGANLMYALFREKNAIRNSLDAIRDGQLRLRDESFGGGVVAGLMIEFTPCTRVGIQYLSPVKLRFKDKPRFEGIGPILESLLAATGVLNSTVTITANVPQSIILSGYHDFNNCWSLMADAGWQQWSDFQKASITLTDPRSRSLTFTPKYKDTWHAAFGTEYHLSRDWTLSGGFAYDSSAVSNAERTADFPVGEQWRFGTGARWIFSESLKFDLCYEISWTGDLSLKEDKGFFTGDIEGTFKNLYIQFFSATIGWSF